MTYDEAVTRLLGMFDISAADAGSFLNDRYRTMVARAEWRIGQIALATTVAGTANYDLPSTVVEIRKLRVGTDVAIRVSQEDLWNLADPDSGTSASFGLVFADAYTSGGGDQIQLYPTPATGGDAITALAVLAPDDLTTGMSPAIPLELHEGLLDGAVASAYYRSDERADLAQPHEASYQDATDRLRRRRNAMLAPKVTQIQLQGFHF